MGQRTAYRIRENGQDTYAYSHWSAVISPFSRLNRALEWQQEKKDMSVTDILLRLCEGDKLHDPETNPDKHPYLSQEDFVSEYFNRPPHEWGDIEMLIEMDLDKGEISYRFDPSAYRKEMDTTVTINDGTRILNDIFKEYKDKVDDPKNIWDYNIPFKERIITPCTITIDDMLERMKSGDVDFIRQHIRRFDETDRWGRYSPQFDALFLEACQMPKGDNQMLEAVTDVYKSHYYSAHSDYNAVNDAITHTMKTDDFERFKLIFDSLPKRQYSDDYHGDYKEQVVIGAIKCGNDTYALYGLKNGIEPDAYLWLLNEAVGNRCAACRDFILSTDIAFKSKDNTDMTVKLLYQAAKVNDGVMLKELKGQGIPMNYNRSSAFFTCMYQKDPAAALVLLENGGDFDKFKSVYSRSRHRHYNDYGEFFRAVENPGELEAAEQDEELEI